MQPRPSASHSRTVNSRRGGTGLVAGALALTFASFPLGVMLWVVPTTGIGIA